MKFHATPGPRTVARSILLALIVVQTPLHADLRPIGRVVYGDRASSYDPNQARRISAKRHPTAAGSATTETPVRDFRLATDNNRPLAIVLSLTQDNQTFAQNFVSTVSKFKECEGKKGCRILISPESEALGKSFLANLPKELKVSVIPSQGGSDRWQRDWGATAVATLPATGRRAGRTEKPRLCIFDSGRGRGLGQVPSYLAKLFNLSAPISNPSTAMACGDYGGNILPTPEQVLMLGNTSTPRLRGFFDGAGYGKRTALVDTSWLAVGHVDEMFSVVMLSAGARATRARWGSPRA